jgi:hypothetical protein
MPPQLTTLELLLHLDSRLILEHSAGRGTASGHSTKAADVSVLNLTLDVSTDTQSAISTWHCQNQTGNQESGVRSESEILIPDSQEDKEKPFAKSGKE